MLDGFALISALCACCLARLHPSACSPGLISWCYREYVSNAATDSCPFFTFGRVHAISYSFASMSRRWSLHRRFLAAFPTRWGAVTQGICRLEDAVCVVPHLASHYLYLYFFFGLDLVSLSLPLPLFWLWMGFFDSCSNGDTESSPYMRHFFFLFFGPLPGSVPCSCPVSGSLFGPLPGSVPCSCPVSGPFEMWYHHGWTRIFWEFCWCFVLVHYSALPRVLARVRCRPLSALCGVRSGSCLFCGGGYRIYFAWRI